MGQNPSRLIANANMFTHLLGPPHLVTWRQETALESIEEPHQGRHKSHLERHKSCGPWSIGYPEDDDKPVDLPSGNLT